MRGADPIFKVQLAGMTPETPLSNGLFTVHTDTTIDKISKTDLIIIPAVDGDLKTAIDDNKAFLPWIMKQYDQGAEVASLCLGAFLLASTGLLNGRSAATHWLAANEFRTMFPEVNLVTERIITDENRLYTSGGAFSYMNLILHIIEKYAGADMAILVAKVFAIEIERENQASFIIFQGQKYHEDEPIKQAQDFIEQRFDNKITVDELAAMVALGRRSFERRFKRATGNTVAEYIQRVKIEAAKKSFELSRKNISEVMYDIGYSDPKAFRTIFKRITGLSPVAYRNKYNREAIAV
jgi:transcriptional regulator GlxA family with amidase domain